MRGRGEGWREGREDAQRTSFSGEWSREMKVSESPSSIYLVIETLCFYARMDISIVLDIGFR